jgi:hypothetical protein
MSPHTHTLPPTSPCCKIRYFWYAQKVKGLKDRVRIKVSLTLSCLSTQGEAVIGIPLTSRKCKMDHSVQNGPLPSSLTLKFHSLSQKTRLGDQAFGASCNPSTREAKTGGSRFQGQPKLHRETLPQKTPKKDLIMYPHLDSIMLILEVHTNSKENSFSS